MSLDTDDEHPEAGRHLQSFDEPMSHGKLNGLARNGVREANDFEQVPLGQDVCEGSAASWY